MLSRIRGNTLRSFPSGSKVELVNKLEVVNAAANARKAFAAAGQRFEETGITQGWDRTKAALRPAPDTGALTH